MELSDSDELQDELQLCDRHLEPRLQRPFNEVSCVARLFTPEDRAVVPSNDPNGCNIKNVIGERYEDGSWGSAPPQPICRTATRGRRRE